METRDWTEIEGIVVEPTYTYIEGEDMDIYYYEIRYRFVLVSKIFYGDNINPLKEYTAFSSEISAERMVEKYMVGEKLKIYYNENDPSENTISVGIEWKSVWKIMLILLIYFFNLLL